MARRGLRAMPSAATVAVVGALAALVVWIGFEMSAWPPPPPSSSAVTHTLKHREKAPPRQLLVIGDSWSEGGAMNLGPEWPALLDLPHGWTLSVDAVGGSGYIGDEPTLGLRSGGRLTALLRNARPALVLVALGRNDVQHAPDDVAATAREDLGAMKAAWPKARIVVFSPFSPTAPDVYTDAITVRLEAVSQELGMRFLDVSHLIDSPGLIVDQHPNDAGQRAIARRVQRRVSFR